MKGIYLFVVMAIIACSGHELGEEVRPEPVGEPIRFSMCKQLPDEFVSLSFSDNVMCLYSFTAGDEVGIFAYSRLNDGNDGEPYAVNVKYVYDGMQWNPFVPEDAIRVNGEQALNVYAYYPYRSDAIDHRRIPIDNYVIDEVKHTGHWAVTDALLARCQVCNAGVNRMELNFIHACTSIWVYITGTDVTDTQTTVSLCGMQTSGVANLTSEQRPVAVGKKQKIEMYQVSNRKGELAYWAVVPDQEIAPGENLFEVTMDGTTYLYKNREATVSLNTYFSCMLVYGNRTDLPEPDTGGMNITLWFENDDVSLAPISSR